MYLEYIGDNMMGLHRQIYIIISLMVLLISMKIFCHIS